MNGWLRSSSACFSRSTASHRTCALKAGVEEEEVEDVEVEVEVEAAAPRPRNLHQQLRAARIESSLRLPVKR